MKSFWKSETINKSKTGREYAVRTVKDTPEDQWHAMRWLGENTLECMQKGTRIRSVVFIDIAEDQHKVGRISYVEGRHYDVDIEELNERMTKKYGE